MLVASVLSDLDFLIYVVPPVLFWYGVKVVALRFRASRSRPDPHLGRKAACLLFVHLSVLILLVGLTLSAVDLFAYLFDPLIAAQQAANGAPGPVGPPAPRDWFNDNQRGAAGLALSGLLHGLAFWAAVRWGTNHRDFPAIGRAAVGQRLVIAGLIALTVNTIAMVSVMQKGGPDYDTLAACLGTAVVWAPAAAVHLLILMWTPDAGRTRDPDEVSGP